MRIFNAHSTEETKELGKKFAEEICGGETAPRTESQSESGARVVCLEGDLGAGKTTFTQGLLEALGARGPYTSPTFVIMKKYEIRNTAYEIRNIFHVDAYRIKADDLAVLGWEEILADPKNVVIIEWPENISSAIPESARKIKFEWVNENERKIKILNSQFQIL